jgi:hypothetical protein
LRRVRAPRGKLAEHLAAGLGRPVTAACVRQILLRARARFVGALVVEVSDSLGVATPDEVEQELVELGLLESCRPHLRRSASHPESS